MVSLLSLSAELKLSIIEQLDLTPTGFIPGPSQDLLSISRVCKVFRSLALPFLLRNITLLNEQKSGSHVLAVLESARAVHVRNLHFVGIMEIPLSPENRGEDERSPFPDDLPESTEQVLSNLAKLPNLERVTMQFVCAKTNEEHETIYTDSYDIFEELETDEQVREAENTIAYRSLTERSYRALSQNPASSIKNLELKDIVTRKCSAWQRADFQALLQGLSTFTISLRGGDNGAGWQINKSQAYLDFIAELDIYFLEHLSSVKHFSLAATDDGPPGLEGSMNNTRLPLLGDQMPQLQTLSLEEVFISDDLSAFITAHSNTLQSIRLNHCFSGWNEDNAAHWGQFFRNINSKAMPALRLFDISISDIEQMKPGHEKEWRYGEKLRAQELRKQYPARRMLDYKYLDDKYGMVFDMMDLAMERFESGSDHEEWERLCELIKRNIGDDS